MNTLIRMALRQRLVVVVAAACLLVFGVVALRSLSVDAFPDVTNVQVLVATEAPGRSPEEVERFVTVPIEIGMTGLPGMTDMRTLVKPGLSLVTLVFSDDTDVYFARQLVMERLLEIAPRLPDGITPVLGPVSTGLGEIYQYTLEREDDGDRALTQEELMKRRTVQDWVVRPLLRSIPGVAEINSQGGYVRQYQVLLHPDRMHHHEVTVPRVFEALQRNNANSGGGVVPHYAEQHLVRGLGLVNSIDDIGGIVLKQAGGTPVYVRNVADVQIGYQPRVGALLKDGRTEAVGAVVMMVRGGNAKDVVSRIKERVAEINARGMLPDGLRVVPFYDRSELVDAALLTVTKVLIEGVILVVIVLFLFLGDLRSSLIVVGTLVITPLVTFLVMNRLGLSANLMSLGGLAIAIGLVVDGSVVVVENTFARLGHAAGRGRDKVETVFGAVSEVAVPVVFGVGIIVLVFLPLMTLEGMEGRMFSPLAFTIAIALTISLVLSLVLSPALCVYVLRGGREHDTRLIAALRRRYLPLLGVAMRHPRRTVALGIAAFAGAVALVPFLGTAYVPEMKEGALVPNIIRAPNISLEESLRLESQAMALVKTVPGVRHAVSALGRGESPADPQAQNESSPIVSLAPRSEWPDGWDQDTIADAIREKLRAIPGAQVVMAQPISDRVDELVTGVRADVAAKIFGDDLRELARIGNEIVRVAGRIRGVADMRVERATGQRYLTIDIDRAAISRYGINVADIHDIVEIAIGGKVATGIFEGERRFDAAVRLQAPFRDSAAAIRGLLLPTPSGARVSLDALADVTLVEGPAQISREMGKRRLVVGINVRDRDLGGFVADLQAAVAREISLPAGYSIEWGGQFQNMARAMAHLGVIVPVTVGAIFFLLFLLFGTLWLASLIILVLPFASIGGIVALFVTGEYLSVPASVGFIALWGIAVLNGVVLVSCIRGLRVAGKTVTEAVLEGAAARFRPVMMTATVAMLGLVPFLFATGPGAEVQRPLAVVVIGGLISCTLLTLVMLPALYPWFDRETHSHDAVPHPTAVARTPG
ncbi:MAG: CusA/CzcA family heavy metal efflux RND transporter [Betaproteobacteria bacterium]|nr:CusA/CzcA family heavy metal efflux RND transporter [Betaproteobacteria bacterium]